MSMLEHSVVYKPFKYAWAVDYALQHEKIHWGSWELELQADVNQWKMIGILTPEEKNHITQILRLFTTSDVQVASNYCDLFIPVFKSHEIRQMLLSFAAREGTHQRSYALLNDTLGLPETEYSAFLEYQEMVEKIEFMQENDTKTLAGLGKALAQSVCNEGMSLFSAFIMLLNYQRFGKMKGMCTVIEWSIRDEELHTQGMSKLFKEFCKEHPRIVNDKFKKSVYEMYIQAVALEDKVIDLAFAMGTVEGLEPQEVKSYIRYIANRRLLQIGFKPIWEQEENPLPWVDWIVGGDSLSNFFEKRVSDYSNEGLKGDWGW